MVDWKSIRDKARSTVGSIADLANEVAEKANEVWNSEESLALRNNAKELFEQTKECVEDAVDEVSDWTREHGTALVSHAKEVSEEVGLKTSEMWNSDGMVKFRGTSKNALKVISGIKAIEDRKKSIQTREEADLLKADIEKTNEAMREDLNEALEEFGKYRLEALSTTVGRFLDCLEKMNQRSKVKEYEFLTGIDLTIEEIKEMESVDMKASDALRTLAVSGGFAAIGIVGTPMAVTGAVTAMCAASTGTAISSLSGAAASNAVLAWLGGGTIASGGGGVAAGTLVLGAATATATVGLAVIAAGTLASRFYAKKNTEAEAYLAEVKVWAEQVQAGWTVLSGVKKRIDELHDLTEKLEIRTICELEELEKVIHVFDSDNQAHVKQFQQCAILAKSMSELAQTPLLDDDGNLSEQSGLIASKTEKILNTDL